MPTYSKILHIDIETYSSVDLAKCGVYRYAESKDFEILLFAYSYNEEPVTVIDLTKQEQIPLEILMDLDDPEVLKVAHNAAFERICLSKVFGETLDPEQWQCTMIMASELGLPASLDKLSKTLGFSEDKQKMSVGKRLINYFCKPCKPTKANGDRTRNLSIHDTEKWNQFKEYNRQDVVVEQAIYEKLIKQPAPESEWELWAMDQRINDYGVLIDTDMVQSIIKFGEAHAQSLKDECVMLTDGVNINSIVQLKEWLSNQEGYSINALTKESVSDLLETNLTEKSRRLLEIRQEVGKTSVKKYESFDRSVCSDNRMHGLFQFYGGRTGRWAGRLVQPQNFPRNSFEDIGLARKLVKENKFEELELLYGSANDVFSTLIRTVIIPPTGKKFAIADYSAIEARVIAWITDEKWRQDVFANGGDIYCASASQMFKVPVEKHGQNSHLRKKGKVAELALGYGGGVGALEQMGGAKMGLTEEEMQDIVKKWRAASPKIRQFWYEVGNAAKKAMQGQVTRLRHGLAIFCDFGFLQILLPSNRKLSYVRPKLELDGEISYEGMDQTTKTWKRISTWGGKLVENIVQAVARDCLAESMKRLEQAGYKIVMHVHDEVIVEVPETNAEAHLEKIEQIMSQPLDWAPGLILTADGFTSEYYRKD